MTPALGTPASGTIDMTNITIDGTKAEFDTALSDDNFGYVGTTNTWTANQIFNDNVKTLFGTGSDASILYDGTNMIIDAQEVGSGILQIENRIILNETGSFAQMDLKRDTSNLITLAKIRFFGLDSGAAEQQYADIIATAVDATDGSEDGNLQFRAFQAGATRGILQIKGGIGVILLATDKLYLDSGVDNFFQEPSADLGLWSVGGENGLQVQEIGTEVNVICGANNALATNATDGFLYIPGGTGNPSGTPTSHTGKIALYYDTTNNEIFVYNGSWRSVAVA